MRVRAAARRGSTSFSILHVEPAVHPGDEQRAEARRRRRSPWPSPSRRRSSPAPPPSGRSSAPGPSMTIVPEFAARSAARIRAAASAPSRAWRWRCRRYRAGRGPTAESPGIVAAANSAPTDVFSISPMTTSMIDGGIRMPSVPAEAMVPIASACRSPAASIGGSAISESSTTEAPTTPIGAARMVPMTMTATARPPGTRLSSTSVASACPWRRRFAPASRP